MAILAVFASAPCTVILKVRHAERNFIVWPFVRDRDHPPSCGVDCTHMRNALIFLIRRNTVLWRVDWALLGGSSGRLIDKVSLAEGAVVVDGCRFADFCVVQQLGEILDSFIEGGLCAPEVLSRDALAERVAIDGLHCRYRSLVLKGFG